MQRDQEITSEDTLIEKITDGLIKSLAEQDSRRGAPPTQHPWKERARNEARDFLHMMQAYEAAKKGE